jgi:hypothetical protein
MILKLFLGFGGTIENMNSFCKPFYIVD